MSNKDVNKNYSLSSTIRRINTSCLVVGAGGFIGFNLCLELQKHYQKVYACDHAFSQDILKQLTALNIEIINNGINGFLFLQNQYRHIEDIFYFAGNSVPSLVEQELERGCFTDQETLVKLLSSLKNMDKKVRFFFGSSGGTVYGETGNQACVESMPCQPVSSYGLSKLTQEQYIQFFARKLGFKYYIARISNPYGRIITHPAKSLQGFIDNVIFQSLRHSEIKIWGDGSVARDFIHINDLVNALSALARNEVKSGIYNIASAHSTTLNEVLATIESLGMILNVNYYASRCIDIKVNLLNNDKLRSATSWTPKISIQAGIQNLLERSTSVPEPLKANNFHS